MTFSNHQICSSIWLLTTKINTRIRLGQILEIHLGQEFWYFFYENLHSYRFFGVEFDSNCLHCEKCSDFRLSRRFQDGRHQTRYATTLTPWGYIFSPIHSKIIWIYLIWIYWTILVIVTPNLSFSRTYTGGHYSETQKYAYIRYLCSNQHVSSV